MGILKFEFLGDPVILEVHVFRVEEFEGKPTETEGMLPVAFNVCGYKVDFLMCI